MDFLLDWNIFYDHTGLLRIYGVAYKTYPWGSIYTIKSVFIVKLMEIITVCFCKVIPAIGEKNHLPTVLLHRIAAPSSTHINLVIVYYMLCIARVLED